MLLWARGEAKAWLRDPDGALADWRHAVQLDPEDIGAMYSSAFLLEREGRLAEAAETWREIIDWSETADSRSRPCGRSRSCTASPRPSTTRRRAAMARQRSSQTHLAVLTSGSAYGELGVGRSLGVMSFDMINGRAGCVAVAARESAGRSLPGLDPWRGIQCVLPARGRPATTLPPTGGPESARACRPVA